MTLSFVILLSLVQARLDRAFQILMGPKEREKRLKLALIKELCQHQHQYQQRKERRKKKSKKKGWSKYAVEGSCQTIVLTLGS